MALVIERLVGVFGHTHELAASLEASGLQARNGAARSNTVGGQLWCIVGARESYARAIESGGWDGFSCSLDDPHSPDAVRAALERSQHRVLEAVEAVEAVDVVRAVDAVDATEAVDAVDAVRAVEGSRHLGDAQQNLLLELLEHEVQHHGQLIRFFYANDLPFPMGFAGRYSLS